jgi:hypothetical protein
MRRKSERRLSAGWGRSKDRPFFFGVAESRGQLGWLPDLRIRPARAGAGSDFLRDFPCFLGGFQRLAKFFYKKCIFPLAALRAYP